MLSEYSGCGLVCYPPLEWLKAARVRGGPRVGSARTPRSWLGTSSPGWTVEKPHPGKRQLLLPIKGNSQIWELLDSGGELTTFANGRECKRLETKVATSENLVHCAQQGLRRSLTTQIHYEMKCLEWVVQCAGLQFLSDRQRSAEGFDALEFGPETNTHRLRGDEDGEVQVVEAELILEPWYTTEIPPSP